MIFTKRSEDSKLFYFILFKDFKMIIIITRYQPGTEVEILDKYNEVINN